MLSSATFLRSFVTRTNCIAGRETAPRDTSVEHATAAAGYLLAEGYTPAG